MFQHRWVYEEYWVTPVSLGLSTAVRGLFILQADDTIRYGGHRWYRAWPYSIIDARYDYPSLTSFMTNTLDAVICYFYSMRYLVMWFYQFIRPNGSRRMNGAIRSIAKEERRPIDSSWPTWQIDLSMIVVIWFSRFNRFDGILRVCVGFY